MTDVVQALATSPLFAFLGAAVLLTILLVPLVLRASGMTGKQILNTLALTLQFFSGLVTATRESNRNGQDDAQNRP